MVIMNIKIFFLSISTVSLTRSPKEEKHGNSNFEILSGSGERREYVPGGRAAACDAADAVQGAEKPGR
jgi:hypothetical protein